LSKEFLNHFKTAEDVDFFLKKLHTKVYEGMLEGEMGNP
jgi:hypothetical protein